MAVHTKFAVLADRLITKHGRPMTLAKGGTTPKNALKPWLGHTAPATEDSPGTSITAQGVFVNQADQDNFGLVESDNDGTQLKRGQQQVLVAQDGLSSDVDISQYDILIDSEGDRMWRILESNTLQPGTTRIITDLTVAQ